MNQLRQISIIIVSYNSSALLVECVRRALASSWPVEVIVSDNGSTDGSVEPLAEMAAADGRLRVLHNGGNLGFAAANNRALPLATGEYVLFLNPDCLIQADTLVRMLAAFESRPDAGMAGCRIRNADGSEELSARRRLPTPRGLFGKLLGVSEAPVPTLPAGPTAVEAISGAFMLVRRAALARVGSFDAGYFMHWEDLDLCRRFGAAGWAILFVPDVEVLHFKGRSSRRRPLRVEWHKHRGLMRYFRKFHFTGGRALLYPLVVAAVAARFLAQAARLAWRPPREVLTLASADGSGDGGDAGDAEITEVWVFGATSLIGRSLLPRLLAAGFRVRAFCRDPARAGIGVSPRLTLHGHDLRRPETLPAGGQPVVLIHLAPLFALPPSLPVLAERGLRRVIAFGSTSAFTKATSADAGEQRLARDLADAETAVGEACERAGLRWAIFRPTMIYALGHDRNITRLSNWIARFRFFPMPGAGRGLRQPVHADDLARACLALLASAEGWNRAYNLSGGEVLTYRAMVEALFRRLGRRPRIVYPPAGLWRLGLALARWWPGFRDLNPSMLRRVDQDMSFSHEDARRAFGYAPRRFLP